MIEPLDESLLLLARSFVFAAGTAMLWAAEMLRDDLLWPAFAIGLFGTALATAAVFANGPNGFKAKVIVGALGLTLIVPTFAAVGLAAFQMT